MNFDLFDAARELPHDIAIIDSSGAYSFAELAGAARFVVRALEEVVREGEAPRIALTAGNDVETVIRLEALMTVGAAMVPTHPRLTDGEREAIVDQIESVADLDYLDLGDVSNAPVEGRGNWSPVPDDERTMALVHTSGTSATPKGVVLSRRAFAAAATASESNLGWQEGDRWLIAMPIAHVGGLSIITRCLRARRTIILHEQFDPGRIRFAIERQRATLVSLVPTMLAAILDDDPNWRPPPSLRAVLLGGAASPPPLLERARDAGIPVLTTWGMTETCAQFATQRYGTACGPEQGSGPPLPGNEVRIVGEDAIEVRGPTLMSGYASAGSLSLPCSGGWFRTGDFGRLDDEGRLHVHGRVADRIITGGENVSAVEVENSLLECPGIINVFIFGIADEKWGEIVAALVVDHGRKGTVAKVEQFAESRLAPFKIPRRIFPVDTLPKQPSGALDREACRDLGERLSRGDQPS